MRGRLSEMRKLSLSSELSNLTVEDMQDGKIAIILDGRLSYIDRNQGHFLKLWLQEHVK